MTRSKIITLPLKLLIKIRKKNKYSIHDYTVLFALWIIQFVFHDICNTTLALLWVVTLLSMTCQSVNVRRTTPSFNFSWSIFRWVGHVICSTRFKSDYTPWGRRGPRAWLSRQCVTCYIGLPWPMPNWVAVHQCTWIHVRLRYMSLLCLEDKL